MENVYSHNEEDWVEDFDDALESAKDCCLYDHDRPTVYVGDKVEITHKGLSTCIGSVIVDNMQEWAYEEAGDHADSYLDDLDSDKLKQLSDHVAKWLDANAEKPVFYAVKNINEYEG